MNEATPLRIVYLTAGAAGMFCGSCMHDNTLARSLMELGCDVQLLPLYTPIRTDETSVAAPELFFGGINVYLQQQSSFFRHLPRWFNQLFDQSWLLNWATSRGMKTKASDLGALTVSILQGEHGNQRREVERLSQWLEQHAKPEVLVFTNMLVAGSIPTLKRRLQVPVVVTLQGDDIFLNDLLPPYKSQAFAEISRLVPLVDCFIVNSEYYADFMANYFHAPREKFRIVPLGIDVRDFTTPAIADTARPPTIGYLARLAPEKGLHVLVEAFIQLHRTGTPSNARLRIAGWLGAQHRAYAEEQFAKLRAAGLADKFEHVGEVDRPGKLAFLRSIDLLSVPTVYQEPKGLFVLEALAMGVPVVQPRHGAFPELLAATGGGKLVPPNDPTALAETLASLLSAPQQRHELGQAGQRTVHASFTASKMAERTLLVLREMLSIQ